MKDTVRKMLATGETRQGIAELLDVSVSYVRSIDVATPKSKAANSEARKADEASGELSTADAATTARDSGSDSDTDDDPVVPPGGAVASDPEAA
jgi:hypothetical protein